MSEDYSAILAPLREVIDRLRDRAEEAEAEVKRLRWTVRHHADIYEGACEDAVIFQRRAEAAEAKLAAVETLHVKESDGEYEHCLSCLVRWPCPTVSELR